MALKRDYPENRGEFHEMFATDRQCQEYLAKLRWPGGYKCIYCGQSHAWVNARGSMHCAACDRQFSVTSGTLLHRLRYPLKTWFEVAWNACEQKNGISALGLQRAMGFGSYHTAWEALHRIRQAMVLPGRSKLNGEVEVDEAIIGGVKQGKRGRGAAGKVLVFVAAEVRGVAIGRARLLVIPDATASTLLSSVQDLVEPGSYVVTDGLSSYNGLDKIGYNHYVSRPTPVIGKNLLPKAHRVISLLKRWLLGTHQGAISHDRLQSYLDEFVFRFNRRSSKSRGLIFRRLLEQAAAHPPISKAQLLTP